MSPSWGLLLTENTSHKAKRDLGPPDSLGKGSGMDVNYASPGGDNRHDSLKRLSGTRGKEATVRARCSKPEKKKKNKL